MSDDPKSFLSRLGIKTSEKWFKVVRNGREYWESETFRQQQALEAENKEKRSRLREALGIKDEDVERNADLLLALLERCYPFGDPSFNPDIIYRQAANEYGFEPKYVLVLIDDLIRRRLVWFEYSQDPSLHPKDSLDHWRLSKKA
jgi:hypothetical protein